MSRENNIGKEIVLSERHSLGFDKYQFILRTKSKNSKVDNDNVKDSYTPTYYKKLKHLCDDAADQDLKDALEKVGVRELSDKFESMLRDDYVNKCKIACEWFSNFLVTEEVEKELKDLKRQLNKANDKVARLEKELKEK